MQASLLLISSATLLTLSAAPFGQWYLAWFGLAPWLIAVGDSPNARRAMLRGVGGGILFFAMNLWWLWTASVPGTFILIAYFSLYWGAAAAVIHALGLMPPPLEIKGRSAPPASSRLGARLGDLGCILGAAVVWVAFEWLRCNVVAGFPWIPLGATQTPVIVMCQVADLGGPSLVSFWVALINALVAVAWLHRHQLHAMKVPAISVGVALLLVAMYGAMRCASTSTRPGPRVMALQSNFRHLPGGAPTATPEEVVKFFLIDLEERLGEAPADMTVLPEAAFPPINAEARNELARAPVARFLESTHQQLVAIGKKHDVSLLLGGNAVTGWTNDGNARVGSEIRNSAYYLQSPSTSGEQRYDKMHLVPFSEQSPFAKGPAWLRRLGLKIAASRAAQPLAPGELHSFKPFELTWRPSDSSQDRQRLRFIAPICLEVIDPRVVAGMMLSSDGVQKRVELIANLSNDGWFATQEKHQHFQSLVFRSIEHRVPLVRSSNTGISGWIDSTGRICKTVAADTSGAVVMRVDLDDRVTPYSRYGDVFAGICLGMTAIGMGAQVRLSFSE
jgi:apolipoprotein N-acyltransferase